MKQGFTLIELVIAVSISLLATGVIIVNYNSYNSVQVLKQAALTLKNDFRFLQSKAANGEKPPGVTCSPLLGWNVSFESTAYSYQANCAGFLSLPAVKISLSPGVTFSSVPGPFMFNVLTRGTSLAVKATITLTGSGKQYILSVSPSGDISDVGIQ